MKAIDQAIRELSSILGILDCGTADRPRKMARIAVTLERIQAYQFLPSPPKDETRGGSSSPVEVNERQEDRKVGRAAERDAQQIADLLAKVNDICARYTVPVDYDGVGGEPGCVSCARKGERDNRKIGGHFRPVAKKYQKRRLCRWCGEHSTTGRIVDLDLMDLSHREGENKASREYAKRYMPLVEKVGVS